jgi:hypothetical protein
MEILSIYEIEFAKNIYSPLEALDEPIQAKRGG